MFGLTGTGFNPKRLEDLKADLEADLEASFGVINKDPDSVLGQLIAVYAKQMADVWELMETIYNSQYPAGASGVSLDNVADITAVKRLPATRSYLTGSAVGDQGTSIPAARIVSVLETGEAFESVDVVTIDRAACIGIAVSIASVVAATDYTITINAEPLTYTSDADPTDLEIAAGLVAAITGGAQPVTATDNGDGTIQIDADDVDVTFGASLSANLTAGKITAPMTLESEALGPVVALAGTLTEIETPYSGWDSISNRNDATLGRNAETDEALRLRRAESLVVTGAGTVEAIRAQLRQNVSGVLDVFVVENPTGTTDGDGRPPHSLEAIVSGGTDADVAEILWQVKPGGIELVGNVSEVVVDSQGFNQAIKFSRATEIYLWVQVTLTLYSEESFPSDGLQQVADKILEFAITHTLGKDVIVQRFFAGIYDIPGIAGATVQIATSATAGGPPGSYLESNLAIAATELAVFDSTRIAVT